MKHALSTIVLAALLFIAAGSCYSQTANATDTKRADAPVPPPSTSTATPHLGELHPAFLLSEERIRWAIQRGEAAATRNETLPWLEPFGSAGWIWVRPFVIKDKRWLDPYIRDLKWARGKSGKAPTHSMSCILGIDGVGLSVAALSAAKTHEPFAFPEEYKQDADGTHPQYLDFEISLKSVPSERDSERWLAITGETGTADNRGGFKDANEQDVKVVKFELTDDKGDIFTSDGAAASVKYRSGTVPVKHIISEVAHTATQVLQRYTLVEHPYYTARCRVRFPLFGADGRALIGTNVKRLTLRVITDSGGELTCEYNLPGPMGYLGIEGNSQH